LQAHLFCKWRIRRFRFFEDKLSSLFSAETSLRIQAKRRRNQCRQEPGREHQKLHRFPFEALPLKFGIVPRDSDQRFVGLFR
jgi:Tfp pilus assembly protein PilP